MLRFTVTPLAMTGSLCQIMKTRAVISSTGTRQGIRITASRVGTSHWKKRLGILIGMRSGLLARELKNVMQ